MDLPQEFVFACDRYNVTFTPRSDASGEGDGSVAADLCHSNRSELLNSLEIDLMEVSKYCCHK